jgi:L-Ala-D/L-Glu epimerase
MMIIDAVLENKKLPLKNNYNLSFTSLKYFDAVLLHLNLDNGEKRIGEVIALPGYTWESTEDILLQVRSWIPNLLKRSLDEIRNQIAGEITNYPCAVSLILSAIDQPYVKSLRKYQIPIVYPTSSDNSEIIQTIENALNCGYRTIKIKIGRNLEKDLAILPKLKNINSKQIKYRFDANQAYSLQEAETFLKTLEKYLLDATELVEQPLPAQAWQEMAQLTQKTSIPLMLDESIYQQKDITRAVEIGCQWIKLKLIKQGGVIELQKMAQYAYDCGLKIVIGNGVATDISNMLELSLYGQYPQLFTGASESNGFVKITYPVWYDQISVNEGSAVWSISSTTT